MTSTQKRAQLTEQNIYQRKVHFANPNFYFILSHTQGPIPQVIIWKIFLKKPILKYANIILNFIK